MFNKLFLLSLKIPALHLTTPPPPPPIAHIQQYEPPTTVLITSYTAYTRQPCGAFSIKNDVLGNKAHRPTYKYHNII